MKRTYAVVGIEHHPDNEQFSMALLLPQPTRELLMGPIGFPLVLLPPGTKAEQMLTFTIEHDPGAD